MSLCIGICQMDEFGYCSGCGRSQAEIDGTAPAQPDSARPTDGAGPDTGNADPTHLSTTARSTAQPAPQSPGR